MSYSLDETQQNAAALTQLLNHPGWQLVESRAKERFDGAITRLLKAKPDEVPQWQAEALAMQFVLKMPSEMLRAFTRQTGEAPE